MARRGIVVSFSILLLVLPIVAWGANIPAKVYENGANDLPSAQAGVKVDVFGGYGFKALLSSMESGSDGGCVLKNVPLGRNVLVRFMKSGYVPQYDIRAYTDGDVQKGVVFWVGSEAHMKALYNNLGGAFDAQKSQVYLEINDEMTGEGIEGIQLTASSGDVFDLGRGEYLVANAAGTSLKVGIQKPGYAFDIESATIPLFVGGMTQYYIKVQSGGAVNGSVQSSGSAPVNGRITTVSGANPVFPLSGVSVAFTFYFSKDGTTAAPTVTTNADGRYSQTVPTGKYVTITPTKPGFTFKPVSKTTVIGIRGKTLKDFKGVR